MVFAALRTAIRGRYLQARCREESCKGGKRPGQTKLLQLVDMLRSRGVELGRYGDLMLLYPRLFPGFVGPPRVDFELP